MSLHRKKPAVSKRLDYYSFIQLSKTNRSTRSSSLKTQNWPKFCLWQLFWFEVGIDAKKVTMMRRMLGWLAAAGPSISCAIKPLLDRSSNVSKFYEREMEQRRCELLLLPMFLWDKAKLCSDCQLLLPAAHVPSSLHSSDRSSGFSLTSRRGTAEMIRTRTATLMMKTSSFTRLLTVFPSFDLDQFDEEEKAAKNGCTTNTHV